MPQFGTFLGETSGGAKKLSISSYIFVVDAYRVMDTGRSVISRTSCGFKFEIASRSCLIICVPIILLVPLY